MTQHLPGPEGSPGEQGFSRTVLIVATDVARSAQIAIALRAHDIHTAIASTPQEAHWWVAVMRPALAVIDLDASENWRLLRDFHHQHLGVVALADQSAARTLAARAGCLKICSTSWPAPEIASHVVASLPKRPERTGILRSGTLRIDFDRRRITFNRRAIELSPVLFDLLAYLASNPGKFVTTKVLLEHVWGESWASHGKVHAAILKLRRRLGIRATSKVLVASRGHGYGWFP